LALLVVDTGSPVASVAVGAPGKAPVVRTVEQRRSSEALLRLIDEALREAGLTLADLGGLVGLAGPGSFTGLRVGLATLLGLHQATGLPATAWETFDVLAAAATQESQGSQPGARPAGSVLAAVDALRGEWFTRLFDHGRPAEDPMLRRPGDLATLAPCVVSAFGAGELIAAAGDPPGLASYEPDELASTALALTWRRPPAWDARRLTAPLYLRPAAAAAPVR
jgi:tRNA threonylcarbamoyl adenosine modification protein YeaZ